jgi:hypothetical protein
MPTLPAPQQIRAQDTRLPRVGADSSGLCRGPKQKTSYYATIFKRRTYKKSKESSKRAEDAYLGAGVRFAESFCAEILGHGRLLLQRSHGANSVVDLGFPQLIGGESSRVPMMSTHTSVLVDSVGPPSAEVCRTAASFP